MDNIPKITEEQVQEEMKLISELAMKGTITRWLDAELSILQKENPVLYQYITERSLKFAMGVMMAGDPQSIAISLSLEYIILIKIMGISFGGMLNLGKFNDMMSNLLKGGKLEGLDDFDKRNGK